jgi:hypothetical protein
VAEATWDFPLRQSGLDLPAPAVRSGWDIIHHGQATSRLQARIIRSVRLWRPDIVVICDGGPADGDPAGGLFRQIAVPAIAKAADGAICPEQLDVVGLSSWRMTKTLAISDGSEASTIRLENARLATHLGCCLADYAAIPRGLLWRHWEPLPATFSFQVVSSEMPLSTASQDFFSGLVLPAPGEARREPCRQSAAGLEMLSRMAQRRRNLQAMISRGRAADGGNVAWLAQLDDLTRELGPIAGGELLFQLAEQYGRSGQPVLAADALDQLISRGVDHPLADAALVWLLRFYSSREVDIFLKGETPGPAQYLANVDPSQPKTAKPQSVVRLAGTRADRAAAIGQFIRQNRPTLYAEPQVQFALASVDRRRPTRSSDGSYESLSRGSLAPGWNGCARGEEWLAENRGVSPRPTMECGRALERPRLDGKLDDKVWQSAKPVKLWSAQKDDDLWPSELRLARDSQFLYLSAKCQRAPGYEYPAIVENRTRDAELRSMDRIELLLDIDRDYSTSFCLTVDCRGWAAESCFGDSRWNPNWYVASAQDEQSWTVEAAIPLTELQSEPVTMRSVWAVGLRRVVPGVGVQGWTENTSVLESLPDSFGYLLFP